MLSPLKPLVTEAAKQQYAVPAFNVFGYEDAKAVIQAAEQMQAPVIIATNVGAIEHMPLRYLAPVLIQLASEASIPVCVHLDHGKDLDAVKEAIHYGFTSVMYDGSQLPLADNIRLTREIVQWAKPHGVSVEAEIGSVGYSDPTIAMKHEYSDPEEVAYFVNETGVDAVAVSVGTVHRMEVQEANIDFELLQQIEERVATPIVIHGSTGLSDDMLQRLVTHRVGKVNIGTALRLAFGRTLRQEIIDHPHVYDRIQLFQKPMQAIEKVAIDKYKHLGWGGPIHDE